MTQELTPVQQASAINNFVKKLGYEKGLDVIRSLDIQDTIAVSFKDLQSRPNHPITAVFDDGLFHFDNHAHLKEVFGEVLGVVTTAYDNEFKNIDFYAFFEYLVPASPVVNLSDYESPVAIGDDDAFEDDEDDADSVLNELIGLDSDADIGEVLEPESINTKGYILVYDNDIDEGEEFNADYESFVRLYQAFATIVENLDYHKTKQVTYSEETTSVYSL